MKGRLRTLIKITANTVLTSRAWTQLEHAHFRQTVGAVQRRSSGDGTADASTLLVCTNGNGNLGDQAMFEAFLANTAGRITAVMRHARDFTVPSRDKSRVDVVSVGGVLTGRPSLTGAPERAILTNLARSTELAIVGADIMDGAYGPREAVFRAQLLGAAARAGIPSRVLGFSWSDRAHKSAVRVLRSRSKSALLLARDPRSLARLHDAGIGWATIASDTVFSLPPVAGSSKRVAPYMVLNVSGLIHARQDLTEDYIRAIQHIRSRGLDVIVLPHVRRSGDDDLAAAREVLGHVNDPGVFLAEDVDSPAMVSSLVADAEWVLTGRMHLGILALNHGTPAIVLSTQGKVEGLMGSFDLESLALEPERGFATKLAHLLELETREPVWREKVDQNLSRVRELSRENFRPITV